MSTNAIILISISIIFAATTLGSAFVYFIKKEFSGKTSSLILGFASGIMVSAAFFGLILPSIDQGRQAYGDLGWIPAVGGFLLGGLLLFGIDKLVPHIHNHHGKVEGIKTDKVSDNFKFFLAVTIHNIPEGLGVGLACGIAFTHQGDTALALSALSLAIGIAIQNIPEGAAVSIPMFGSGVSRTKSFLFGTASGAVEPVAAFIGLFLASSISGAMPWLLAFGGGAMIYVTMDEIMPETRKDGYEHYGLWAFMISFAIMMVLEIMLS